MLLEILCRSSFIEIAVHCSLTLKSKYFSFNKFLVTNEYGKCCKISNTFNFLFSNKMLGFRAVIDKMLVRIASREDPDQTPSEEAV